LRVVSERIPSWTRRGGANRARRRPGRDQIPDLSQNRQSDYVFSWDRISRCKATPRLTFSTRYTRVRGIFRKLAENSWTLARSLSSRRRRLTLARHLFNFGLALESAAEDYRPNFLCAYLYELAGHFARFYENCPVLKAEGTIRATRLALSDVTARVLKEGLQALWHRNNRFTCDERRGYCPTVSCQTGLLLRQAKIIAVFDIARDG